MPTTVFHQLAQAAYNESVAEPNSALGNISGMLAANLDVLNRPETMTKILSQIHIVWAVIFILVGMMCILNGYKWHKGVVVLLAGMSGVWAGSIIAPHLGNGPIAAVCLAILFAVLAWPLLKYSVSLFGGLAGAFAGANIWTALELPSDQHKFGALIGLLVIGMLTFLAFRVVVVLMTAIGGASLLVFGGLAAMMHVDSWRDALVSGLTNNDLVIPILAASAAGVSAVIQLSGGFKGMAQLADKADASKSKPQAEKKAA